MPGDLFEVPEDRDRRSWHGAAFSLEALILLLFLVISTTILMQLFSLAYQRGQSAAELTPAVTLAANEAEAFSADPLASADVKFFDFEGGALIPLQSEEEDAYAVARTVTSEKQESGTLYRAVINVTHLEETVYSLTTACYVSGRG